MPSRPRVDRIKNIFTAAMQLNFGWRIDGYPSTPYNNGVTSFVPQLHRVTIRFCRKNEDSRGVRNFIQQSLARFAAQNPATVVYVQPVRQNIPLLRAEYANGRVIQVVAKNFEADEVERHLNLLRTRSGEPVTNMLSRQSAAQASVQGTWHPMLNISTEQSITELPSQKFSTFRSARPSATEFVTQLVGQRISDSK